jgi:phosphoribosylanthranilate isomerase
MTLRVKICCIASEAEAALAIAMGASAIGLVSEMPSGPGPIPDRRIAEIARTVPRHVHTFLLTSRRRPADIASHFHALGTSVIQIVDALQEGTYDQIRAAAPAAKLVQVIHVAGTESLEYAQEVAPFVDALLLDSGRPNAPIKELGGTGRTHDWQLSRAICESVNVPVFLAGGLRPENVAEAIERVRPFGIDVCSGLRTNGALDEAKVRAFMTAAGVRMAPIDERMW